MPLTGLDAVDWLSLNHAYGPAKTTADELRALLSDDAGKRSQALDELTSSICHQGSVYPATAAAVPFLVEIASTQTLSASFRVQVVYLVCLIAEGAADLARDYPKWGADEPWAQVLYANLRQATPHLLDLVRGPDSAKMGAWAVWVIRAISPTPEDLDALRALMVDQKNPVIMASIALTLPADDPVQRGLVSPDEDPLVRLCAAAQLIAIAQDLDFLVGVAKECVPESRRFEELPVKSEDTSAVRLIAARLGMASPAREVSWIELWLRDPAWSVEALFAAWHAAETRRSSAPPLVDPVSGVLVHPPVDTPELLRTAALSLEMLGLPGVARLRELLTTLDGHRHEAARSHLAAADDRISASESLQPIGGKSRPPAQLAAQLQDVQRYHISEWEAVKALDELACWAQKRATRSRRSRPYSKFLNRHGCEPTARGRWRRSPVTRLDPWLF